jgi:xylono-1,5-lactonase
MREVRCVWQGAAELGEGPVWSASDKALWFVDIKGRRILRLDPVTATRKSWPAPDQVSFVLPETGGNFIAGLPGRLVRFFPATGRYESVALLEAEFPRNRLNDACIDSAGRLWFGTMDDDENAPSGALYCWHGIGTPIAHDRNFIISNGPAHSPDGQFMYHTDTVRRTIYRFDAAADGTISNKQSFIEIEDGAGFPDGTAVDIEGCLWVALWQGGAVRRYSPQGELLEVVGLPCANVTKLAFGGDGLTTAFVTTARAGLNPEELNAQKLAGSIFAFETDIPGLPPRTIATTDK